MTFKDFQTGIASLAVLLVCGYSVGAMGQEPMPPQQQTEEREIQIAMAQIMCIDGDRDGNLKRIEYAAQQANQQGADIVCFPEMALRGWVNPVAHQSASPIPGTDSDALCELAKQHGIYLSIGLAEKVDQQLFDAAILIDDQGEIVLKHRKINVLTELMTPPYTAGDQVATVATKFGKLGLLICADTFDAPTLAKMAKQKPTLLLVPYGWANRADAWPKHGESLKQTVSHAAKTIGCPVVGTNLVGAISQGPWQGMIYGGQSYVCLPDGSVVAQGIDRDVQIKLVKITLPPQ